MNLAAGHGTHYRTFICDLKLLAGTECLIDSALARPSWGQLTSVATPLVTTNPYELIATGQFSRGPSLAVG